MYLIYMINDNLCLIINAFDSDVINDNLCFIINVFDLYDK